MSKDLVIMPLTGDTHALIPVTDLVDALKAHMQPGGTLEFDGCNIAQTPEARKELQEAADRTGIRIIANGNSGLSYDSGAALRHRYVFTPVKPAS